MSKRIFQTFTAGRTNSEAPASGTSVLVEAGWDRPLGWLFLNVERLDRVGGRDVETVFTNLERPDPGMTVEEIQQTLKDVVGHWPEEWMREVKEDRETRPGNDVSRYGLHDPIGLENRLQHKRESTSGLTETIRTLHDDGRLNGSVEAIQTLFRLGILSDPGRLREAFVIVSRWERPGE